MWRTGTLGLPSAPAMALHARAQPPMRSGCCRHAAKAPLLLLPRLSGNAHGTSSGRCIVACRASGSSSEHSRRQQDSPHGFGAGGGSSGGSAVSPSNSSSGAPHATTTGDVSCKATAAAAGALPPFSFPATPPGKQPAQALHDGLDTSARKLLSDPPVELSSAQTNGDTEKLSVAAAAAAAMQYGPSVAQGSDQPATPTDTTDAAAIRQEHTSSTTRKSSSSSSGNCSGNSSATALAYSAETSAGISTGNHRGSGGSSGSSDGNSGSSSGSNPANAAAAAPLLPSPSSASSASSACSRDAAINTALAAALAAAAAFKFVTVDFESWGRLPVWDLLMQMPDSNWRAYVAAVDANPLLTKVGRGWMDWVDEWVICRWVGGCVSGRMDGWTDGWVGGWIDGWVGGCVSGWADGWMGGCMG